MKTKIQASPDYSVTVLRRVIRLTYTTFMQEYFATASEGPPQPKGMKKPTLVIKFGSAVLSGKDGKINTAVIRKIATERAVLYNQ